MFCTARFRRPYPGSMASTTGRVGRPREFDLDDALENALGVFWDKGYEGATLSELTTAMGITKTSMYKAFGNKEQLFRKVLDRYSAGPASYGLRALQEPTARAVASALLHGAVRATTGDDSPTGCLGVQGALATGDDGAQARDLLIGWRDDALARLEERFVRARSEGDVPQDREPRELALYVMTVAYGIAVQAATGRAADELHTVAETALGAVAW